MNSGLKPVQRAAAELGLIFCGASTRYLCPSSIACFAERMRRSIRSREPMVVDAYAIRMGSLIGIQSYIEVILQTAGWPAWASDCGMDEIDKRREPHTVVG